MVFTKQKNQIEHGARPRIERIEKSTRVSNTELPCLVVLVRFLTLCARFPRRPRSCCSMIETEDAPWRRVSAEHTSGHGALSTTPAAAVAVQ